MASPRTGGDPSVAGYKQLLRDFIERRPSGTRQRIAQALGTHKSFVSQVTNPLLPVPLPAPHVATIFKICHFVAEEREAFLEAYRVAHPSQAAALEQGEVAEGEILQIQIPRLKDPAREARLAEAIEDMAAKMIALAREAE